MKWLALAILITALPVAAAENGKTFPGPGGTLYYEVTGAATGTPLIVVNGGPGFDHNYVHSSNAWESIGRTRPVVFYDQRGNGRSEKLKPGAANGLAEQIADLDAIRDELGADKADLLGHSWGGYLVMAYTARHPEHVRRLIIVDSAAPKWTDTKFLFAEVFPEGTKRQEGVAFAQTLGDKAALDTYINEYLKMLFYSSEKRDAFLARSSDYHYDAAVNALVDADVQRFDLGPELLKFKLPTLVITGRYDINVAPIVAWKIHKAIAGSRFEVFEKSGHIPYFEEPEKFAQMVSGFLD